MPVSLLRLRRIPERVAEIVPPDEVVEWADGTAPVATTRAPQHMVVDLTPKAVKQNGTEPKAVVAAEPEVAPEPAPQMPEAVEEVEEPTAAVAQADVAEATPPVPEAAEEVGEPIAAAAEPVSAAEATPMPEAIEEIQEPGTAEPPRYQLAAEPAIAAPPPAPPPPTIGAVNHEVVEPAPASPVAVQPPPPEPQPRVEAPSAPPAPAPPEPVAEAPVEDEPPHIEDEEIHVPAGPETCTIAVWRGYLKSRFYARTVDPYEGEVAVAESATFKARGNGALEQTEDAVAAYQKLVELLEKDGWRLSDEGSAWYASTLVRE